MFVVQPEWDGLHPACGNIMSEDRLPAWDWFPRLRIVPIRMPVQCFWPTLVCSFQGIWLFALSGSGSNLRTVSQYAESCSRGFCWCQWSHVRWAILLVYLNLKYFPGWGTFSSCQLKSKSQIKQNKFTSLVSLYIQPKYSFPPLYY